MESLLYVFGVLAVFSMVHERVLEMLRVPRERLAAWLEGKPGASPGWTRLKTALDALTIGSLNWVSGVALALVTHADLLALLGSRVEASRFADFYMTDERAWSRLFDETTRGSQVVHLFGCVLMGFSTTVGSKFWHDALSGLMDLRKRVKDVEQDARKLSAKELKLTLETVASERGDSKATNPEQVQADTARALQNAANKALTAR